MLDLADCIDSLDEVRAVLGLNVDELSDDILNLTYLPAKVEIALNGIHDDLLDDFSSNVDIATTEAVGIFNIYFVASQLLSSIPGLMPKQVSDGKATIIRFASAPYEYIEANVYKGLSEAKANLLSIYGLYKGISISDPGTQADLIGNAVHIYDPVTGE
ncbi:hypothetical protein KAR91_71650 [Candidatus Pacearchaeota archaeon]|nr:hypothetical protein [Candidatus Pacearchaeota archaeon]